MSEILKKPYEISVWEDRLVEPENGESYYKEVKLAVIGSSDMTSPNRVYSPVLTQDVNQETTLTFSLDFKYFDPVVGKKVENPFRKFLINERKIKLKYDDQWFDFVIKNCEESSDSNTFNYTATDLFIQELSKVGYNVTFDNELGGNQGTAVELGKKVLENTDWVVDTKNSDLLKQLINEPIYNVEVASDIVVLNVDTGEEVTIEAGEIIYVFYSYLANRVGANVQFIREADRSKFIIDDNNTITSTNYRFQSEVTYPEGEIDSITVGGQSMNVLGINLFNHGNRLFYGQRTTYDPVMARTVNIYQIEDEDQQIYEYTDYQYATSDIVTSFITNGSNFNIFEDGTLQGWSAATPNSYDQFRKTQLLGLTTYPEISSTSSLAKISQLSQIQGFLELQFAGALTTDYKNTYFNSGFMDNQSLIDHVSKGEEYVLRVRWATANERHGDLIPYTETDAGSGLRLIVAKYDTEQEIEETTEGIKKGNYLYKIRPDDIILNFDKPFSILNNKINNGYFDNNYEIYIVEGVVQEPSNDFCYIDKNDLEHEYVWDGKQNKYIPKENSSYLDYYITTAIAQLPVSNTDMTDPGVRIGIFLYTPDSELTEKYVYVENIQLTKCYRDENGQIVTIGNVPTATSTETQFYYLKPLEGTNKEDVETYTSLETLAETLGTDSSKIVPVYNENCEKILTISASKSNCFNILQSICETFECWLKIDVLHDETGALVLDKNNNPFKRVAFKEYVGKDNFAGFKYGINLETIQRTLNTDEFVTKLIVTPIDSSYTDKGTISIQSASSNPSGESYIFNFSYYLNHGLITNVEACNRDLNNYYEELKKYNTLIYNEGKEKLELEEAILRLEAKRNVYTELIEEAQNEYTEAISDFEHLTKMTYEEYVATHETIASGAQDKDNLVENDTIVELIGKIYTTSATINNYAGLLTNTNAEYKKLKLKCYGAQEYSFTVTTTVKDETASPPIEAATKLALSDYIDGFGFTFYTGSNKVYYESSANDKSFSVTGETPYQKLHINKIPDNYRIKFYDNGRECFVDKPAGAYFDITANGEPLIRRFKLVPTDQYKKDNAGYDERIKEYQRLKDEVEKKFYKKYSRYIQEGTWSSNDYIDSELYYLDALQVSNTSSQPKVSYEIKVLDVSPLEMLENYTFEVGDKTYIEDVEFFGYNYYDINNNEEVLLLRSRAPERIVRTPVNEEVIVSSIENHLDEPEENIITIRNYKTQFEDLFQRLNAAVQSAQFNQATYAKNATILDNQGLINSNLLVDSLNSITADTFDLTSDGAVSVTEEGIKVQNLTNPANSVKIVSRGLRITQDGGQSWKDAVTAEGVSADVLTTGTINTQNIWITDGDNPSFRWDKAGLSAYGFNEEGNEPFDLKTYVRFDKYGLYGIKNGEDYVASSLEDIKDKAHFGITWDGFFIKNSYKDGGYVSITSDNDFQVVQGEIERIKIGALDFDTEGAPTKYGININNVEGDSVFRTDDNGDIVMTGTIYAKDGEFTGTIHATDGDFSGTINATAGGFSGYLTVGNTEEKYIIIDGQQPDTLIASSDYIENPNAGWAITGVGDAVFNNITARGSIKTAVFEYSEIEAVGGAFLFRPSTSIKKAKFSKESEEDNDIIVEVEKPNQIVNGDWYKISNYNQVITGDGSSEESGLTAIYKASVENGIIKLKGAAALFNTQLSPTGHGDFVDTDPESGQEDIDEKVVDGTIEVETLINNVNLFACALVPESGQFYLDDGIKYDGVVNGIKFTKIAVTGTYPLYHIVTHGEESDLELEDQEITYIGNLTILNSDLPNTGENFVIVTYNQDAILYTKEPGIYSIKVTQNLNQNEISELEGATLISFGKTEDNNNNTTNNNYGIGINSGDNYIGLPARAISLFESVISPNNEKKVTYNFQGILGTLPSLPNTKVDSTIYNHMKGTQGIFTDNMYIGDKDQYVAFYKDGQNANLKIKASQIMYEAGDDTYKDISEISSSQVIVYSTTGTQIINSEEIGALYVRVFKDNEEKDAIGDNIAWGTSLPATAIAGDRFILLNKTNKTAILYYYDEDNNWVQQSFTEQYEWSFKNKNNVTITGTELENMFGSAYDPTTGKVTGKCLFISADTINSKITAEVKVTIN